MVTATIVSKIDLKILDALQVNEFEAEKDIEFSGKSKIETARKPNVNKNDYIVIKDKETIIYMGICDTITNEKDKNKHAITALEIENIFDCDIVLENEKIIANTGIEDFIAECIKSNFAQSNDTFLNLPYIKTEVKTHTKVEAKVDTDNEIFNLKTYMGNALMYYGIFFEFKIKKNEMIIEIKKKEQNTMKVDANHADITNYMEDYQVDVLAKLTALWKIPDKEEDGITTIGAKKILNFFLLNNRTITEDATNENRAAGKIQTVRIEKETLEEVKEEVYNAFKGDSYEHSVEAKIKTSSKLYPVEEFYIGHNATIKTKSHGVKESIITRITKTNKNEYIEVKFGNMPITLIEKIRKENTK